MYISPQYVKIIVSKVKVFINFYLYFSHEQENYYESAIHGKMVCEFLKKR